MTHTANYGDESIETTGLNTFADETEALNNGFFYTGPLKMVV
jgi:hypothetical protein